MDCQYIIKNDLHEKYILGKLDETEKREYEAHLQKCVSCQREYQKQKLLISAIRRIGKQEMKQEIHLQLEPTSQEKRNDANWGMILKVAAALLFFVIAPGLIYYHQNMAPSHDAKLLETGKTDSAVRFSAPATDQSENETTQLQKSAPKDQESEATRGTSAGSQAAKYAQKQNEKRASQKPVIEGKMKFEKRSDKSAPEKESAAPKTTREKDIQPSAKTEMARALPKKKLVDKKAQDHIPGLGGQKAAGLSANQNDEIAREMPSLPPPKRRSKQSATGLAENQAPSTKEGIFHDLGGTHSQTASSGEPTQSLLNLRQAAQAADESSGELVLKSGNKLVQIHFIQIEGTADSSGGQTLPDEFPVRIVSRDSSGWKMNWVVPPAFMQTDLRKMRITNRENHKMTVQLADSVLYQIDLKAENTQAVRIEKQ